MIFGKSSTSIQKSFLLASVSLSLLFGFTTGYLGYRRISSNLDASSKQNTTLALRMLQANLALPLLAGDREEIARQCRLVLDVSRNVAHIAVSDKDGRLLLALPENFKKAKACGVIRAAISLDPLPEAAGGLNKNEKTTLGFVEISRDIESIRFQARMNLFESGLVSLACVCILLLAGRYVERRIIQPLVLIEKAAERIAAGNYDQTIPVDPRGDELSRLASLFNTMAASVKARDNEVRSINSELRDFAYIVSHDLKAPLRGISSLATWLKEDYAQALGDDGKKQIELLVGRVVRMNALIDGILRYSRVGRIKEEHSDIDLNELVPQVISMIAPPDNINIQVDSNLPVIHFEATRIQQVFQNLIANAVKYMDKEDGRIHVGCEPAGRFWRFFVKDNGPGIAEEYYDRVFKIFQTLSSRDRIESTGVGLAIVKKIVQMYGGTVNIESETGKGTTFFFTLPRED